MCDLALLQTRSACMQVICKIFTFQDVLNVAAV